MMIPEKLVELQVLLSAIAIVVNRSCDGADLVNWNKRLDACNTNLLVTLASAHGVIPWLVEAVKLAGHQVADTGKHGGAARTISEIAQASAEETLEFSQQLENLSVVGRFHSAQQSKVAVDVSTRLTGAGLDHVVFKGVAAMQQFYAGYVSTRVSDDLDLLVRPESVPEALNVLMDLGYRAREGYDVEAVARFVQSNSSLYRWRDIGLLNDNSLPHQIDLHWRIADHFTYPVDASKLIESMVYEDTPYGVVRCLEFSQHFVYVCVHGYSDCFFRLRHLVDVYAATQQASFDSAAVMDLAKSHGVEKVVVDSIRLAHAMFLDGGAKDSAASGAYVKRVVEHFIQSNGWPKRVHPNKGQWSFSDKRRHLARQIANRSRQVSWLSPLKSRVLLTHQDIVGWNGDSAGMCRLFLKSYFRRITS